MANWFVSSVGYTAVTAWAALTTYAVGDIRRPFTTPTVGNERVYRADSITTGISGSSEPTWTNALTKNSTIVDSGVTWREITGLSTYDGGTFAAPHATLWKAVTTGWPAADDTVFVAKDHTETSASATDITLACQNRIKILCINATHSATPVAADLAIMTNAITSATSGRIITTGNAYFYGINLTCGSGANSPNFLPCDSSGNQYQIFDNCTLKMGGTAGGVFAPGRGSMNSNGDNNALVMLNTTLNFTSASHYMYNDNCAVIWKGGTLSGTKPTTLINTGNGGSQRWIFSDVDLSLCASSNLTNGTNLNALFQILFNNCKVGASVTVMTGTIPAPNMLVVDFIISDSGNKTYTEEHYMYGGSVVHETTNYRTGGATDGTTPKSWKVVTLSTATKVAPTFCPDIYQWVDSTGSKTVSVYISNNSSVTAQDLDIGFELEYMGDASTPFGTFSITSPAGLGLLSTGTNWGTDSSTWGGSTTNKQVMTKTITINQKGWIRVKPFVTKASFTVWIDPLISVA